MFSAFVLTVVTISISSLLSLSFGFHPDQEVKIEDSFFRIDSDVVNSVCDQLWTKVCSRFPFTNTNTGFRLHLQSPVQPSNSQHHNVSMQLKVDYRLPMAPSEE